MHLFTHHNASTRPSLLFRTAYMHFSTATQPPKETKKAKAAPAGASVKKKPIMLMSEYGELLNIRPMVKAKTEVQYKEVQMIGDNSDAKTLMKKLNTSPNTFFLFDPKAHFTNAQTLYLALKRQVAEKYYGRKNPKKKAKPEEATEEGEAAAPKSMKGTSFENCQLPSELFNVNRMVKMNTKQILSRFGFLTLRDG